MKAIINLLILLFVLNLSNSCNKINDESNEVIKIVTCYDETKGSDPWIITENDSILISNVKNYLLTNKISAYDIELTNDGTFETCKATYCKTGRRFKVTVDKKDLNKIQNLRFYECK